MISYLYGTDPDGFLQLFFIVNIPVGLLVFAITRFLKKERRLKVGILLFITTLFLNPLQNWIVFQPINYHALLRMKSQAEAYGLIGRSPNEIISLFGEPTSKVLNYGEKVTWRYKPLPFYLMGSQFEVHFEGNNVVAWEHADD